VVVGHKILNLEELYAIAQGGAEVIPDSQTYAELNTHGSQSTAQPKVEKNLEGVLLFKP